MEPRFEFNDKKLNIKVDEKYIHLWNDSRKVKISLNDINRFIKIIVSWFNRE